MGLFSRKPREMQSDEKLAYAVLDSTGLLHYMSDGIDNCYSVVRNSQNQGTTDLVIRRIAYRLLEGTMKAGWVQE